MAPTLKSKLCVLNAVPWCYVDDRRVYLFVKVLAKDVLETYAAKGGEVSKGIQVDVNIDASNFYKSVCTHRLGLV